jgi:hypothetical protein
MLVGMPPLTLLMLDAAAACHAPRYQHPNWGRRGRQALHAASRRVARPKQACNESKRPASHMESIHVNAADIPTCAPCHAPAPPRALHTGNDAGPGQGAAWLRHDRLRQRVPRRRDRSWTVGVPWRQQAHAMLPAGRVPRRVCLGRPRRVNVLCGRCGRSGAGCIAAGQQLVKRAGAAATARCERTAPAVISLPSRAPAPNAAPLGCPCAWSTLQEPRGIIVTYQAIQRCCRTK